VSRLSVRPENPFDLLDVLREQLPRVRDGLEDDSTVSIVFLVVAAVASLVPAERAARRPPAVALRAD
jgi:ABC-type lipoprotein release transport system permease subunit